MDFTWRDRKLLILLATGSLLMMTGAVIAPVLPKMIQQLGLDPATAGYLVSAHYLTVAIFSPLLGFLADRTGAVRVLGISLVLYAISGAAGGLLNDFVPMLVTRGVIGAASGGIAAASLGLLVRRYPSESTRSQAIAAVAVVLTLANIVYPILGGVVGSWHWRGAFALYTLALPLAFIAATQLRSGAADSHPSTRQQTAPPIAAARHPRILQLCAIQCLTAAIAHATIIYLPLYLKATLNAGAGLNGMVLASQALGAAAVSGFGVHRLARRLGLGGTAILGLGGMGLTLAIVPQLQQLFSLLPTVIGFGAGLGLVVPSVYSWVANLAPPGLQSSVLAICVGANFLGQFLSPLLFGFMVTWQGLPSVFVAAAGLSLGLGITLMVTQSSGISKG